MRFQIANIVFSVHTRKEGVVSAFSYGRLSHPVFCVVRMAPILALTNGRVCYHGTFQNFPVYVDTSTGLIIPLPPPTSNIESETQTVDLQGRILAPAFLELQTNGALGVHFTQFDGAETYSQNLERVSRWLVEKGVGSWWVTLPTVKGDIFRKVSRRCLLLTLELCWFLNTARDCSKGIMSIEEGQG